MASSSTPDRAAQLHDANAGLAALFNDDVARAQKILGESDSAFHLYGRGMIAFIDYSIGMEDAALARALDCLYRSETVASKMKASASPAPLDPNGKQRPRWWNASLESDVLVADSVVAQAMCAAASVRRARPDSAQASS